MFWVFCVYVCVCVVVHVYMRRKGLHILVYSSLLNITSADEHRAAQGNSNVKDWQLQKQSLKKYFFFSVYNSSILLVPMIMESFYIFKE